MASISSLGIGSSGLDIRSIVDQLVKLEKRPLAQIQSRVTVAETRISALGQLRSAVAEFQDAARALQRPTTYSATQANSSAPNLVSARSAVTALPGIYSVSVSQIAQGQTLVSPNNSPADLFSPTAAVGAGTLTIQMGRFDGPSFTPGIASPLVVDVTDTDTLVDVARKINEEGRGVSASVINVDGGQRLVLRSRETGVNQAFTVAVAESPLQPGLARLSFDGSASSSLERTVTAQNTLATVDGIAVESSNATLSDIIPGTTLTVSGPTSTPVTVTVQRDTAVTRKAVEDFVSAYNQLNALLADALQFDPQTKVAGPFQGDVTVINTQSALRQALGQRLETGSSFQNLSQLGIRMQKDGSLQIEDNERLTAALADPQNVRRFFTSSGQTGGSAGLADRLVDFTRSLLDEGGRLSQKQQSLNGVLDQLRSQTDRVNQRAQAAEERLLQQFSRLDANLAQLNALNQYVSQQIQAWNNTNKK
ncbi:flagellar filament capping protein FliD [Tepidicella xavieri]|uniref:Flagellar hook-associated protein 2 n=1 Tax=Tepidicella xavieri TaxID=360241 RepID=A0A4R6UGC1_9BURK|nr:flagellar filament capping protein FliD [Tepidicella xavieri]TDQ45342.1 flagellar hook-associated protein 2 [Tepidicella xavieri]